MQPHLFARDLALNFPDTLALRAVSCSLPLTQDKCLPPSWSECLSNGQCDCFIAANAELVEHPAAEFGPAVGVAEVEEGDGGTWKCRVLQIKELVKECLRQREADCKIEPAPPGTSQEESASMLVKRCACVDASAFSPLRRLLSVKRRSIDQRGVVITTQSDAFGVPEQIQVRPR